MLIETAAKLKLCHCEEESSTTKQSFFGNTRIASSSNLAMTSEFCNGLWFDMKQRFLQSNEGSLTVFVLYARHEIWRFSVANAQRIKDVVRIVQDSKKELVVCSALRVWRIFDWYGKTCRTSGWILFGTISWNKNRHIAMHIWIVYWRSRVEVKTNGNAPIASRCLARDVSLGMLNRSWFCCQFCERLSNYFGVCAPLIGSTSGGTQHLGAEDLITLSILAPPGGMKWNLDGCERSAHGRSS